MKTTVCELREKLDILNSLENKLREDGNLDHEEAADMLSEYARMLQIVWAISGLVSKL